MQQLRSLEQVHLQRLTALRSLKSLDAETRERLIEAEQSRFRESLEQLGVAPPPQI